MLKNKLFTLHFVSGVPLSINSITTPIESFCDNSSRFYLKPIYHDYYTFNDKIITIVIIYLRIEYFKEITINHTEEGKWEHFYG